jgi:hypothetical protein
MIQDNPYRGSGAVDDPDGQMVDGRTNADFFANLKAQSWWGLRMRFQATHRAIAENKTVDPDTIISLAPNLPELSELISELAQPTYSIDAAGKILIDKSPPGTKSPNLADAVCIAFNPASMAARLHIWSKL